MIKGCLVLFIGLISAALPGAWAIVTLNDFPEYVQAGTPVKLTFTVRQNGQTLLSGLHPGVRATTTGGLTAKSDVAPGRGLGEYTASIILPQPGQWTITIASGFNDSTLSLPSLKVIAPGSAAPDRFSPVTRGLRLFSSKGCVGCHRHIEINPARTVDAKLDLTGKRYPQDSLKKFLADPSIKPVEMPNLKLKDDEIDALAAFINKLASKTIEK
jgi:mono/diheme cytochrome c family protein